MSQEFSSRDAISVQELADWRRNNTAHQLLDVREVPELAICALEGAVHISMGQVPARLSELKQDVPLVVMCHHGMRSLRVVQFLRQAGWENAVNLEGGIGAWADQVDPELQQY